MTLAPWAFFLPAILVPASFVGLALYYLIATPTSDAFFVGPAGVLTGVVLLLDGLVACIGLIGFCFLFLASPPDRRALWISAVLSAIATVATYGMAMQILRAGYRATH